MRMQDGIKMDVKGNVEDYWKRTNIKEAINELKKLKEDGYNLRMVTNPYNLNVIRVDYYHKGEGYDSNFVIWFDHLTDNTEKQLLKFADEHLHGRYW